MTPATLVSGATARQREDAIADALALLPASNRVALILEGLPDTSSLLADIPPNPFITIARIAQGCPCCNGNLTLRVTLNRVLRHPPQQLFISIADNTHLEQLRQFLASAPYDAHLHLMPDIACTATVASTLAMP